MEIKADFTHGNSGKAAPMYYTMKHIGNMDYETTVCLPGIQLNVGDEIKSQSVTINDRFYNIFKVMEILEQRNCQGKFDDPNDRINSFYRLKIQVS